MQARHVCLLKQGQNSMPSLRLRTGQNGCRYGVGVRILFTKPVQEGDRFLPLESLTPGHHGRGGEKHLLQKKWLARTASHNRVGMQAAYASVKSQAPAKALSMSLYVAVLCKPP